MDQVERKSRGVGVGDSIHPPWTRREHKPNVHLAHKAVFVDTLPLAALGLLGPHLLHVLQHHVAVSVKSLDTGQELTVVTAGDQDLGVCAGGGLQEGERAGGELVLLDESDLIFPVAMRDVNLSCMVLVACIGL